MLIKISNSTGISWQQEEAMHSQKIDLVGDKLWRHKNLCYSYTLDHDVPSRMRDRARLPRTRSLVAVPQLLTFTPTPTSIGGCALASTGGGSSTSGMAQTPARGSGPRLRPARAAGPRPPTSRLARMGEDTRGRLESTSHVIGGRDSTCEMDL